MNHITQAKRKLRELLQTNLPLKLRDADAAAADGIITPTPFEIKTAAQEVYGGLPQVVIIATDSSPTIDSLSQVYRHRVVVGVQVGGGGNGADDFETMATIVERYIWAFRQVFRDTQLASDTMPFDGTGPVETGGEQYTSLEQQSGGGSVEYPFVQGGFIEVFITTVE